MSTLAKFTIEEFDRMIESSVFDRAHERRIELINGELREMNPPGPTHEDLVDFLNQWSVENVDTSKIRVRIQNSIGLPNSSSAPQPDVAWVNQKRYRDQRPGSRDVLLVIEVADSSLIDDQSEKARIYAEAEIQEYWIVNIPHRCVEVYREPDHETYQSIAQYDSAFVAPLACSDAKLSIRELFEL